MFQLDQYELLDFGAGRKLERFGCYVLNRPAPVAEGWARSGSAAWRQANLTYHRQSRQGGEWESAEKLPSSWTIGHKSCAFELRLTPFGHVGVFSEQAENWDWTNLQVSGADRSLKVLNLFAYTGGSTLAAAEAGAQIVHVDAAKNVVSWAKRNAQLSGLSEAPIRWIAEDAQRFVEREVRRGNRYDAVILDPPTYGHGPQGEPWKIDQHFVPLLRACRELTGDRLRFLLLSCHSPGFDTRRLRKMLEVELFSREPRDLMLKPLNLSDRAGRKLPCGVVARWPDSPR